MIAALAVFRVAWAFIAALPAWLLGAAIATGIVVLFYEGISFPVFWPLTMITDGNLIDGRVDRVVEQQRTLCEADKARSEKQAREDDQVRQAERISDMADQIRQANERALSEQAMRREFELQNQQEDAEREAQEPGVRIRCDLTPRAASGVQRRNLPYPSANPPGD